MHLMTLNNPLQLCIDSDDRSHGIQFEGCRSCIMLAAMWPCNPVVWARVTEGLSGTIQPIRSLYAKKYTRMCAA